MADGLPKLWAEDRPIGDPANAHRRNQTSSPIRDYQQKQQQHLLPLRPLPRNINQTSPMGPRTPRNTVEKSLNLRLRSELPYHVETQWPIAQPHILHNILTPEEILSSLRVYQAKQKLPEDEDVEALCAKVCGDGHPSCIVVFAMLILTDKGHTIGELLRDHIFDENLPLFYEDSTDPEPYFYDLSEQNWRQPKCFEDDGTWGIQAKLDICKWQWYLQVPYMEVVGPKFQAYEGKFQSDIIFPWSSLGEDSEVMRNDRTEGYGGYSAVYKRHIDYRFHGFHDILQRIGLNSKKGFFALKVLDMCTPAEKAMISQLFENERRQLMRYNGATHNHLVTLLAAFEQEGAGEQEGTGKHYFVFPWAEFDLSAYWERTNHRDARWVSEQLAGLVGALNEIHNPAQNSQTLGSQVYGRHGDLKPENILWFTPYRGDPRGILVVSDMGFTAVNAELSRSKQTNGKPRTPTYRPPELDIPGANVTREYDVWSLGCIFLEMMTWLLGGRQLNSKFKQSRSTSENGVYTSIFFTFDRGQPMVKQEVTQWIQSLRVHKESTEFVHAVLNVIEDKMIIPRADKRSRVRELKREFDRINEKCRQNSIYHTDPYPPPAESTGNTIKDSGYESASNFSNAYGKVNVAYSNSNLPMTVRETYIQKLAGDLFEGLSADVYSIESLERVVETLGENLQAFATRLGFRTRKQTQLDIMHFAHKHHIDVQDEFEARLRKKKMDSSKLTQEETERFIKGWLGGQELDFEHPDSPSAVPTSEFFSDTQDHKITVADSGESAEESAACKRFLEYHDTVRGTAAYSWLVDTLSRDALLQTVGNDHARAIKQEVLKHLTIDRVSRTLPSRVFEVNITLDWNPRAFVQDPASQELPEQRLLGAITFTGSPHNAQALICSDYLVQTWPSSGKSLIQLLMSLMRSDPGTECNETLADGTAITLIEDGDRMTVKAIGVADAVAEVSQQFAWIGAALRPAPNGSEPGLFLCKCEMRMIGKEKETTHENVRDFHIEFDMESFTDTSEAPGGCWHKMLRNLVLVTGFPVRAKPQQHCGVEMPLNIMAWLIRSSHVIEFDRKLILNGFSTMLTAVKHTANYLTWHYTFHADKSRIPFFEAMTPTSHDIHLGLLETSRHVIGWCPSAKFHAGDFEGEQSVEESGLPPPEDGYLLDKVSLSGGKLLTGSMSLSKVTKNLALHVTREVYASKLMYLKTRFVLLWDDKDKRGWLVNGTSALLHLVRGRLKFMRDAQWREFLHEDLCNLIEAEDRHLPSLSALQVLSDRRNRGLKALRGYEEESTQHTQKDEPNDGCVKFEALVGLVMSYLDQVIDYQTKLAGRDGMYLKAHIRRRLEGWDFADITNDSNPRPRVAKLQRSAWGWVDFVRSIETVTLFGRGFGELITPEEPQALCHEWQTLPTDKYYIAVSGEDLTTAMKFYGTRHTTPPVLVHGLSWHSPSACSCQGNPSFDGKHRNPVQVLLPAKSMIQKIKKLNGPPRLGQQDLTAAFVFGHNLSIPVFWHEEGKSLEVSQEEDSEDLPDVPAREVEDLGPQTADGSSATSRGIETSVSTQLDNTTVSSYGTSSPPLPSPLRSSPIVPTTEPAVPSSSHSRHSRLWRKDILTLNFLRSLGKRK